MFILKQPTNNHGPKARPRDPKSETWANRELSRSRDDYRCGMQDYFDLMAQRTKQ